MDKALQTISRELKESFTTENTEIAEKSFILLPFALLCPYSGLCG